MTGDSQKSDASGEVILRDFLEKRIQDHIIPVDQLPKDSQEKFNYDYIDLRKYLQDLFLKGDEFEIEGFESFIFHLIQRRRESLENLFYMCKIFARIKSPLVIHFIIYSNYSEWRTEKQLKPIYPIKQDFGISIDYERSFVFPHFELRNYDYPIYSQEINDFLNLFFENSHKMFSNIDLQDCLDYQSKAILYNKVSPDRYESTLKKGCRVLSRGFGTVYWHIAITRNIPLILDTVTFAVEQIEIYEKRPKREKKEKKEYDAGIVLSLKIPQEIQDALSNWPKDKQTLIENIPKLLADTNRADLKTDENEIDENYFKQQFIAIKYLIDTLGTIPKHFDEFEKVFQRLDNYPKLKRELATARKRQARLVKEPEFKYATKARSNLDYYYDYSFSDYEIIEKLRFKDLSENEDIVYPNDDIHSSDYYSFSYRKAILERCKHPEKIEPKSEREIGNQVRDELGIPRVGEGWKNETFLFKLIYKLLEPLGIEAIHHHRPDFLSGQELDIYFELYGQQVGIEYQGLQHFEPVDYFGGENSFKQTVERDQRKKRLCQENGVTLIYVNHWETVTQQFVLRRLKEHGIEMK